MPLQEKAVDSIHRYPGSDRMRVKYADGNVRFMRGEDPVEPQEFTIKVEVSKEIIAEAVAEPKAEILSSAEVPPDGGAEVVVAEPVAEVLEAASEPSPVPVGRSVRKKNW